MRKFSLVFLLFFFLLVSGCGPKIYTLDIPLQAGNKWTYSTKISLLSKEAHKKNLDIKINVNTGEFTAFVKEKVGDYFAFQVLQGQSPFAGFSFKKDSEKFYNNELNQDFVLLKRTVQPGDTWETTFRSIKYKIVVIKRETKVVPAGKFHCVKLSYTSPQETGDFWIDPKVGLIALNNIYIGDGVTKTDLVLKEYVVK